jgi:hypothetical protein
MKVSGTQAILAHMRRGKSISGIEALNRFGVYRLSDVIWKLRKKHCIVTEMKKRGNKEYAVYRMGSGGKRLILPL